MILPKSLGYKVCEPNSMTWAAWSEATLNVHYFLIVIYLQDD